MEERLSKISQSLREQQAKQEGDTDFNTLSLQERQSIVDEEFMGGKVQRTDTPPITRICLTGGPCAGKTTALAELTLILN